MSLKVYAYEKCGTCKSALKWLDSQGIAYKTIPIRDTPPAKTELKEMLEACDGNVNKLFNTSGQDYRALDIKNKLPDLSDDQVIALLQKNGNLIKRPFVIGDGIALIGFNENVWSETLESY